MTATTDEIAVGSASLKVYGRQDDFGRWHSLEDLSVLNPKLEDFPSKWTAQMKQAALESALANAPKPETPVELTDELEADIIANFDATEDKLVELSALRKALILRRLDLATDEPPTAEEAKKFPGVTGLLLHAHRVRKQYKVPSLSVLAGWAYTEQENGDLDKIFVSKEMAKTLQDAENRRKKEAAAAKDEAERKKREKEASAAK